MKRDTSFFASGHFLERNAFNAITRFGTSIFDLHLPELDQFHPLPLPAADGGNLRGDVPGYHQDLPTDVPHVRTAGAGFWAAVLHAPQHR
mgnify:CR=1 FL=1